MNKTTFVAGLLAGGESRRFGKPKAFVEFEGKTFYDRAVEAVFPYVTTIIIVSHPTLRERFCANETVEVIEDRNDIKGKGPLAGIASVMDAYSSKWYIILPCDMPLIDSQIINILTSIAKTDNQYDAIVPKVDGKIQPLVGIYHQRCKDYIEKMLRNNIHKVSDLLDELHVCYVEKEDLSKRSERFNNINTIEDYRKLQSLWRNTNG
ncbi:molybdenum cofactor guanylyltransferase [Anaerobacillus sp. MEB173]|uniref:molybdenum cofactor guanylyltransferase n=1 Tax=Anaerobacillus sp. MEB173 TaxID=3383345 RepID=UPI003F8E61C0